MARQVQHSLVCTAVACMLMFSQPTGIAARGDADDAFRLQVVFETAHEQSVFDVAWGPDGQRVLTASGDGGARLWDARTGLELRSWPNYNGNRPDATTSKGLKSSIAISPDGTRVAVVHKDKAPSVYDARSGRRLIDDLPPTPVLSVAFSGDGSRLICGRADGKVQVIDLRAPGHKAVKEAGGGGRAITAVTVGTAGKVFFTGTDDGRIRRWSGGRRSGRGFEQGSEISALACTADGKRLLCGTHGGGAALWRGLSEDKQPLHAYHPAGGAVLDAELSRDGSLVALACKDGLVYLYDADKPEAPRRVHRQEHRLIETLALSPDGTQMILGGTHPAPAEAKGPAYDPVIVDVVTGKELRRLGVDAWDRPSDAAFTPDMRRIVSSMEPHTAHLWSVRNGNRTWRLSAPPTNNLHRVALGPEGRWAHVGNDRDSAHLLDLRTRKVTRLETQSGQGGVASVAFLPGGQEVVTGDRSGGVHRWHITTGKHLQSYVGHTSSLLFLTVSPDGTRLLGGGEDQTTRVWSLAGGQQLLEIEGTSPGHCGIFSHDSSMVYTRTDSNVIALTSIGKQTTVRNFPSQKDAALGHAAAVVSVSLSPDGKQLLTGSWDNTAMLWDTKTGTRRAVFRGHRTALNDAHISPDGKFALTTSRDLTVRIWDLKTHEEVGALLIGKDGQEWAVFDPGGRFDGSQGGHVPGLHFAQGFHTYTLEQVHRRNHTPGLLAKILGQVPDPVTDFASRPTPRPPPKLETTLADPAHPVLEIRADDAGGGIGPISVRLNGKQVVDDARGGTVSRRSKREDTTLDLSADPRLLRGRRNTIETVAWNADETVNSRGFMAFNDPRKEDAPSHLWAIVCGVSDYAGDEIDLRYAAKDARDFAAALGLAAESLFGPERVHIELLTSGASETETPATHKNLRAAFERARGCKSNDVFVVYLSGHGTTFGKSKGQASYYYLLADAVSEDLSDDAIRATAALSSEELSDWIAAIPAVRGQLLVLDTCAAGRARDQLRGPRTGAATQQAALGTVYEKTGMFILAGCAADKVSYESSQFGQGLLTYALLHGMSCGCDFKEATKVDVHGLVNYAWALVPQLAEQLGLWSLQRPVKSEPDESFEIGSLTPDQRARIPLQSARPMLTRASFQRERPPKDTHKLSPAVDDAVRRFPRGAAGRPALVFVDTTEMAKTYSITGRYRKKGPTMVVMASVWFDTGTGDTVEVTSFELPAPMDGAEQIAATAAKIVARASAAIRKDHDQRRAADDE